MIRREAVRIAAEEARCPIVSANGFISRDLFEVRDCPSNFYMIGSMGLASSIGAGVALRGNMRVMVLDGDGNILMNLGSLVTIGSARPDITHVILDNGMHESTGGQPTNSRRVDLKGIAKAAGYRIFRAGSAPALRAAMRRARRMRGPVLVLARVSPGGEKSGRVALEPEEIRERFAGSLPA